MKKPRGISWIVFAAVVLAIGGGMLLENRAGIPADAVSPSGSPSPSALTQGMDWEHYAVSGESLVFSYPAKYRIAKQEPGIPLIVITLSDPANPGSSMMIEKYANPDNLTAEDWAKTVGKSNFSASNGILAPTSIGGAAGVVYRWTKSGRQADEMVVQYGDKVYAFIATYTQPGDPIRTDFGRVVSTATFQ